MRVSNITITRRQDFLAERARRAERARLRSYLPASLAVTFVVAILPVWSALWLFGHNVPLSIAISFVLSLVLGRIGAKAWQGMNASNELVFDDLLLWRFLGRLRTARRASKISARLQTTIANRRISREERLKLLKKLAVALEYGDPYTHGHSRRVARYSYMTARGLNLSRKEAKRIQLGALLHDIGKLNIPKHILNKPGRLTGEEFEVIKTHPGEGWELVKELGDPVLSSVVRSHHERLDGSGYPDRLPATGIPLGARIVAVIDTFDAITSKRAYREARKHREALKVIEAEAGTKLDARVVKAFRSYYSGRRSLMGWSSLSAILRHGPEAVTGLLSKAGMTSVTNAMAASSAAVALVGSGFYVPPAPDGQARARTEVATQSSQRAASAPHSNSGPSGKQESEKHSPPEGKSGKKGKGKPNVPEIGRNNGKSAAAPVGAGNNNGKSDKKSDDTTTEPEAIDTTTEPEPTDAATEPADTTTDPAPGKSGSAPGKSGAPPGSGGGGKGGPKK